MKGTVI